MMPGAVPVSMPAKPQWRNRGTKLWKTLGGCHHPEARLPHLGGQYKGFNNKRDSGVE
jgi:hypothetical protein